MFISRKENTFWCVPEGVKMVCSWFYGYYRDDHPNPAA